MRAEGEEGTVRAYRGNPKPIATERVERTAQRGLRLVSVIALVEAGIILLLAATLFAMVPLVRVQPALVQFSDKQFYRIDPIFANSTAEIKAREAFARRYIAERETVNLVNDFERWDWVRRHSAKHGVWKPFFDYIKGENVWSEMERENLTQSVRILGSWPLEPGDNTRWAIEFIREQYRGSALASDSTWVATLGLGHLDGNATNEEIFDNPLRLYVARYSISAKAGREGKGGQ